MKSLIWKDVGKRLCYDLCNFLTYLSALTLVVDFVFIGHICHKCRYRTFCLKYLDVSSHTRLLEIVSFLLLNHHLQNKIYLSEDFLPKGMYVGQQVATEPRTSCGPPDNQHCPSAATSHLSTCQAMNVLLHSNLFDLHMGS